MRGRGIRFLFLALLGWIIPGTTGFSVPVVKVEGPLVLPVLAGRLNRLCQDAPSGDINYDKYFTRPERENGMSYVFYNNIIDPEDNSQFGYALLYGLEFASEKAEADDSLAVGMYFTGSKGRIYLIQKKAFDEFHRKKLTTEALLKYLTVKEIDLAGMPHSAGNK
jgi:hypothetical protein